MKTANFMARGRQHRGVLRDGMLIDAAGEPTVLARDEILDFFRHRLGG